MNGIECAFFGVCGKPPELKTSKAGKPFASFSVGVDGGETPDGSKSTEWVRCTVFGDTATRLAETLHKADRVYVEGNLRLGRWQDADGSQRFGLNVAAWKAEKVGAGAIGRNRPKAKRASEPNTTAPAAPEQDRWQEPLDDPLPI
jgi:single-strand DNA-binding protein